jgi:hypothetical protein
LSQQSKRPTATEGLVVGVSKDSQQICAGHDLTCTFFRFHFVQYGNTHRYAPLIAMIIMSIACIRCALSSKGVPRVKMTVNSNAMNGRTSQR